MTDRELLELAAKAAGELHLIPYKEEWLDDPSGEAWNPLRFDGDALRLAVKLKCLRGFVYDNEVAWASSELGIFEPIKNNDPYAATRRAIVRAAAEVGKGMLSQDELILMFPGRFDDEVVDRAAAEIGKEMP